MSPISSSDSASASVIRCEQVGITASVGNTQILQDISFDLAAYEFAALVGPSGAGKTSLLRLLNRLIDPSQGAIYLDGKDLRQLPVRQVRQQVMLCPQEPKLLGMTVEEALLYPLKLKGFSLRQGRQQLMEWSEQLRIPSDWLDRTEVQLSLGQRQRVAIARALMAQPRVLLLDEPTSALDLGQGTHLLRTLAEATKAKSMTVLMANHQLDFAQQYCSFVLYLQAGKLIEATPSSQLNWAALKHNLIEAEQQQAEEWGDDAF